MDEDTLRSLRRILDYLREDEMRHWIESDRPTDHIHVDIRRVDQWLDSE